MVLLLWLGSRLFQVSHILGLMLTWGVIFVWFKAGLHIQTKHTCTSKAWLDMINYISSRGNCSGKAHGQAPSQWRGQVYTHCIYTTMKPFQDGEGRQNCEQTILLPHEICLVIFCNILYTSHKFKLYFEKYSSKDPMYFGMILFRQMMLFQFCKLFNVYVSSLY